MSTQYFFPGSGVGHDGEGVGAIEPVGAGWPSSSGDWIVADGFGVSHGLGEVVGLGFVVGLGLGVVVGLGVPGLVGDVVGLGFTGLAGEVGRGFTGGLTTGGGNGRVGVIGGVNGGLTGYDGLTGGGLVTGGFTGGHEVAGLGGVLVLVPGFDVAVAGGVLGRGVGVGVVPGLGAVPGFGGTAGLDDVGAGHGTGFGGSGTGFAGAVDVGWGWAGGAVMAGAWAGGTWRGFAAEGALPPAGDEVTGSSPETGAETKLGTAERAGVATIAPPIAAELTERSTRSVRDDIRRSRSSGVSGGLITALPRP